ncbi:uncharacterized protein LOC118657371 [Myotis myotis]|uniref:uncharacterized protein LOC118657371 n=1 Tax=Myotis myotis TaxID=51298 RepID=UPI0017482C19|nr:uncharacterized protein LOC118657371 [Myotis myotis]
MTLRASQKWNPTALCVWLTSRAPGPAGPMLTEAEAAALCGRPAVLSTTRPCRGLAGPCAAVKTAQSHTRSCTQQGARRVDWPRAPAGGRGSVLSTTTEQAGLCPHACFQFGCFYHFVSVETTTWLCAFIHTLSLCELEQMATNGPQPIAMCLRSGGWRPRWRCQRGGLLVRPLLTHRCCLHSGSSWAEQGGWSFVSLLTRTRVPLGGPTLMTRLPPKDQPPDLTLGWRSQPHALLGHTLLLTVPGPSNRWTSLVSWHIVLSLSFLAVSVALVSGQCQPHRVNQEEFPVFQKSLRRIGDNSLNIFFIDFREEGRGRATSMMRIIDRLPPARPLLGIEPQPGHVP